MVNYPLALTAYNFVKVNSYDFQIPQSDYAEVLEFQIIDSTYIPFNSTGYTPVITIQNAFNAEYVNSGVCTWTNIILGIFAYTPASTDFSIIGDYTITCNLQGGETVPTNGTLLLNVW